MRIKTVTSRVHSRRYESQFRNSRHPWKEKHALLLFTTTDDGTTGVGEAWTENASPLPLALFIENDLAPLVLDQPLASLDDIEKISARLLETDAMSNKGGFLYAATSALDIALHDTLAKSQNIPLYQLLSEIPTDSQSDPIKIQKSKIENPQVPIYASSGMYGEGYTPEKLAQEMSAALAQGFCGIKIKAGGAPLAEDIARAQAVRQAIGPTARLMVDVLWSLDVPRAIQLAHALTPFHLHFLEAPTDRHDLAGWAQIRDQGRIPLAGPEIESGLHHFQNYLDRNLVEFLQADAIVCGGFSQLKKINALACAHQKPLSLHCSCSAVALAANAHFAAGIPNAEALELHLLHQSLFEKLWQAGYKIEGGGLHLPNAPGLGLDISPNDPALTDPLRLFTNSSIR